MPRFNSLFYSVLIPDHISMLTERAFVLRGLIFLSVCWANIN